MDGRGATTSVKVGCSTLQDVFIQHRLERVHFLKSDCEGAEFEIFMNTPPEYLRRIDRISMEYHLADQHFSLAELGALLKSAGFKIRVVEGGLLGMLYAQNGTQRNS